MKASENAIKQIKADEGFAPVPEIDNGHLMWAHGHDQLNGEKPPVMISRDEADLLLRKDLASRYEPAVNALIPQDCTQNQFDALINFAYNLGVSALRQMMAHGWYQVPVQIPRWNHENGVESAELTERRKQEVELFNS